MSIKKSDRNLTIEEKEVFSHGMSAMFNCFSEAYHKKVSFKDALRIYAKWIDGVLTPWYREDIHVLRHKFNDLPIPAGVEILKRNYKI